MNKISNFHVQDEDQKKMLSRSKLSFIIKAGQERFITACELLNPKYSAEWFHELIAYKLQDGLERASRGEKVRIILAIPPRHGKEIMSSTLVPTPNGFKRHGDLKPGDYVFSPDGKPLKVSGIIPQEQPAVIEVTITGGGKVVVHPNHEWSVYDRGKGSKNNFRTYETKWMMDKLWMGTRGKRGSRARFQLPEYKAVQYKARRTPMDPYTLGVWLGDGESGGPHITYDPKDAEEINSCIPYQHKNIYIHADTGVPKYSYTDQGSCGKSRFTKILQNMGVYKNKHIPEDYIFNTEEVRRELLAGLIDTDGYIEENGRVRFVNTNKDLIDGFELLVRSLGYRTTTTIQKAATSSSGIEGKLDVYTVQFVNTDGKLYTKLSRKNSKIKTAKKRRLAITDMRVVEGGPGECITVDSGDGLYLVTDHFIPTHNTHTAAELFAAWALGKYPQLNFILSTYGSDLSERTGLKVRDLVQSSAYRLLFPDIKLRKDVKAKAKWMTNKGGSFTGVGTGTAVTGVGADCLIVDDPHKDRAEAESATVRETVWEYFESTLYSRMEGYGMIVVIMQRWHVDDLVGRLLEQAEELKEAGKPHDDWEVINFPAIAEEDEKASVPTVTGTMMEVPVRREGMALWFKKFPLNVLENIKAKNLYNWASQYMQNPIVAAHQEFKEHMFQYYTPDVLGGKFLKYYTVVDPAISQSKRADNTVVLTIAKEVNGPHIYRVREDAGKFTPSQTIDLIFKHHIEFNSAVFVETNAYQEALKYSIEERQRRDEVYFVVNQIKSRVKKEERMRGLLGPYGAGVVWHTKADHDYEIELLQFPRGKHDDRCDAMAMAVNVLDNTRVSRKAKTYKPHWKKYGRLKR